MQRNHVFCLVITAFFPSVLAFQIHHVGHLHLHASHPLPPPYYSRIVQRHALPQESNDFWDQQKMLAEDMKTSADASLANEQQDKYNQQVLSLLAYSAYSTFFIFCVLWTTFDSPFVAFSYLFGSSLGLAYSYGLGKYVEIIGGVATDADAVKGAGVGQARFAFLILLFIFVGKFRSYGLMEVPSILGFFTYQLGSLLQGLRATDD